MIALAMALFAAFTRLPACQATVIMPADAAWEINFAPTMCVVRVDSVHRVTKRPFIVVNIAPPQFLATVEPIVIIKGKCAPRFTVACREPDAAEGESAYPHSDLKAGHEYLISLDKGFKKPFAADFSCANPVYNAIELTPGVGARLPHAAPGESPKRRLLDLLTLAAQAPDTSPPLRRMAVTQIGYWGQHERWFARDIHPTPVLPPAPPILGSLAATADATTREVAALAQIRWANAPSLDNALLPFNRSITPESETYSAGGMRHEIISALYQETSSLMHFEPKKGLLMRDHRAVRGMLDFDYVAFCHRALLSPAVKVDARLRPEIASLLYQFADRRSIPDLVTFLDDSDINVRVEVETILSGIVEGKEPVYETAKNAAVEARSRAAWKRWWREHRAEFDSPSPLPEHAL